MEVTSEILPFFEQDRESKPIIDNKNVICKINISIPAIRDKVKKATLDVDGDYEVIRKRDEKTAVICLEQSISTRLQFVGLQLWRGALVLSDLVIHLRDELVGKTVLELGAGVGLTSLVASLYADRVICTDLNCGGILQLLQGNVSRNKSLLHGKVTVAGLDWFDLDWPQDIEEHIKQSTIVLAADVVYDNSVTEAFIRTITKILLTSPKTLYIALEKRYVFTIADMDTAAPCYEHLLQCLREERLKEPWSKWSLVEMNIDFPQKLQYERVPQMVLWKVMS